MAASIASIVLVFFSTLLAAFGGLLFKIGAERLKFHIKHIIQNYILLSGIVLYVLSAVFYVIALKGGELTILFPLSSLAYIWVLFLSKRYLKEQINMSKILGMVFIIIGVSLIGIGA